MNEHATQRRFPWSPAPPPAILKIQKADENVKRVYQSYQEEKPRICARELVVRWSGLIGRKHEESPEIGDANLLGPHCEVISYPIHRPRVKNDVESSVDHR